MIVLDATSFGGSAYGKPKLTVHLNNVYCTGSEENIAQCTYTSFSLEDGKALLDQVEVAGVSCKQPNVCEVPLTGGNDCSPGDIRLTVKNNPAQQINSTTSQGNLEYCYKGLWSSVCAISESAATVACKQMGFTSYSCKSKLIPISKGCLLHLLSKDASKFTEPIQGHLFMMMAVLENHNNNNNNKATQALLGTWCAAREPVKPT